MLPTFKQHSTNHNGWSRQGGSNARSLHPRCSAIPASLCLDMVAGLFILSPAIRAFVWRLLDYQLYTYSLSVRLRQRVLLHGSLTRNCLGHFRRHCADGRTRTCIFRQPRRPTCSTIELHLHIVRFCSLHQTSRTPWFEDSNLSSPDWLLPFTMVVQHSPQLSATNRIAAALFRTIIDPSKQALKEPGLWDV